MSTLVPKLKQTTLPFMLKPKADTAPLITEIKLTVAKSVEPKCPLSSKRQCEETTHSHICEGSEVTSSSEAPLSVKKPQIGYSLDPFVKMMRMDASCAEVSSSTAEGNRLVEHEEEVVMIDLCDEPLSPEQNLMEESNLALELSEHRPPAQSPVTPKASPSSQATSCNSLSVTPLTGSAQTTSNSVNASAKKRSREQQQAAAERSRNRELEKELRKQKKLEMKLQKEREIEEKRLQKEQERLLKEKEREEKQRQREELQAKKQAEIDAKNAHKEAERQKREEERRSKEEEKKKKDEEKRLKDEEKEKLEADKEKKQLAQKNAFLKFFSKPTKKELAEPCSEPLDEHRRAPIARFKPFTVQPDMRLAPIRRRTDFNPEEMDKVLSDGICEENYLACIKKVGGRKSGPTWPRIVDGDDDSVMLARDSKSNPCNTHYHKAKLLQFHTDVRPAYFGTWKKKSSHVSPRRPFGKDIALLDYEVDSADEWEEEEPGESVDSHDEDEEEKDEFDFDPELRQDGFLVDHAYLSDDEGGVSDEEESMAAKKTKQMIARTYGKGNRRKTKLKPVVYGSIWEDEDGCLQNPHFNILSRFKAIVFHDTPIAFEPPPKQAIKNSPSDTPAQKAGRPVKQVVPTQAMPDLIRITHGNVRSIQVIIKEFREFWQNRCAAAAAETASPGNNGIISKRQLDITIRKIAEYKRLAAYHRFCWYVHDAELESYGLTGLPVPNPMCKRKELSKQEEIEMEEQSPSQQQHALGSGKGFAVIRPTDETNTPMRKSVSDQSPRTLNSQKRLTDFIQPAHKKIRLNGAHSEVPQEACHTTQTSLSNSITQSSVGSHDIRLGHELTDSKLPRKTETETGSRPGHPVARRVALTMINKPVAESAASSTNCTTDTQAPAQLLDTQQRRQLKNLPEANISDVQSSETSQSPKRLPLGTINEYPTKQPGSPLKRHGLAVVKPIELTDKRCEQTPRRISFMTLQ